MKVIGKAAVKRAVGSEVKQRARGRTGACREIGEGDAEAAPP